MTQPPIPDWYTARREKVVTYFTPENRGESSPPQPSPSGRFSLVVTRYSTGPNTWAYSLGEIFEAERLVASIRRNYSSFPFSWVESHGTTYLVCGEDYQGQTVVDCSTGESIVHVHERAKAGFGFCWASISPNPLDTTLLLVCGCYWGDRHEAKLYRLGTSGELTKLETPDFMELVMEKHDGNFGWVDGGRRLEVQYDVDDNPEDDDSEPRAVRESWDVPARFGLAVD